MFYLMRDIILKILLLLYFMFMLRCYTNINPMKTKLKSKPEFYLYSRREEISQFVFVCLSHYLRDTSPVASSKDDHWRLK